jgi:hypothetical protein
MVGAKQLETWDFILVPAGPYVQQWCARGTILLCTGVPVVGRLQARRERRCGLQVPSGVIEASANIVGEGACVRSGFGCSCVIRMSSPCGEGDQLPFIDKGEGDLQACRTV